MSADAWKRLLEPALRARRFDEVLLENLEHVRGAIMVSIGQEGTAAAVACWRRPEDGLSVNHRNHHHFLANGADAEMLYTEIFGRDGYFQRGRSGTLHLCDPDLGVYHTSAMVGACAPLGAGIALAKKQLKQEGIAFAFFGDGAMGEGVVSESFNLARLWQLPVVFVCECNTTLESVHLVQAGHRPTDESLLDIPQAHRVPASFADATHPAEISEVVRKVVEEVRAGDGPRFVLAQTVPWPGNQGWSPTSQGRTDLRAAESEPSGWEEFDPVLNEVRRLLAENVDLQSMLELDVQILGEMERAVAGAAAAPLAPLSVAFDDVLGAA